MIHFNFSKLLRSTGALALRLRSVAMWSAGTLVVVLAVLKFTIAPVLNSPLAADYVRKAMAQLLTQKMHRLAKFEPGLFELSVGLSGIYLKSHNPSLSVGSQSILTDSVGLAWHWSDQPVLILRGAKIPVDQLSDGSFAAAGIPLAVLAGTAGGQNDELAGGRALEVALLATDTEIIYRDAVGRSLLFSGIDISVRDNAAGMIRVSAQTPPEREPVAFSARADLSARADGTLEAKFFVRSAVNPTALAGMFGASLGKAARARVTVWGKWDGTDLGSTTAFSLQDLDMSTSSVRASLANLSGTARLNMVRTNSGSLLEGKWLAKLVDLQVDASEEILGTRLVLDKIETSGRIASSSTSWMAEFVDTRMASDDILARADLRIGSVAGVINTISLAMRAPKISYLPGVSLLPDSISIPAMRFLRENLRVSETALTTLAIVGDPAGFPWADGGGEFRLGIEFAGAELAYKKGWPTVRDGTGMVGLHGNNLLVTVFSARIGPAFLDIAKAAIDDLSATSITLHIAARSLLRGSGLAELLHILLATAPRVKQFDGLSISGAQTVALELSIPLDNDDQMGVSGEVITGDTKLGWAPAGITLEKLRGTFNFDRNGIRGVSRAELFGTSVRFEADVDDNKTSFSLMGRFDLPAAIATLGYDGYLPIKGSGAITVKTDGGSVTLSSDLDGVAVLLSGQLGKKADKRREVAVIIGDGNMLVDYDDGLMRVAANDLGTAVQLGGGPHPLLPIIPGTRVRGTLDGIDLDAILRAGTDAQNSFFDLDLQMTLANAELLGMVLPQLELSVGMGADVTMLAFKSAAVTGGAVVGSDGVIAISISELVIPKENDEPIAPDAQLVTVQDGTVTGELPALRLTIDTLRFGKRLFQAVSSFGSPSGDIWKLEKTITRNDGNIIRLSADTAMRGSPLTNLTVAISLASVDQFLADFGFANKQVRGGTGTIKGVLSWRGALTEPHFPSLQGQLKIEARDLQINEGSGVKLLRLFSPFDIIGSIATLGEEGTSYDSLNGSLRIEDGVMYFDQLNISGSDLEIDVAGSTNIVTERHHVTGKARATKTNNLAVLGTATAVNPLIAAVVLVFDKVLDKPLFPQVTFNYSVTGTWDDPVFELDHKSITDKQ